MSFDRHVHHQLASDWFDDLDKDGRLSFCRLTQLGFLRLLSTSAVMGDEVKTQSQAWAAYDAWFVDDRVEYREEPSLFDARFRMATRLRHAAPKDWADSYLVAFADAAGLTLVTFDRALKVKSKSAVLLGD